MAPKLRNQLLLYGVLLTWLVGGTVAGFATVKMTEGIRDEANAHVEDVVRSAARLLEDERRWEDRQGVARDWGGIEHWTIDRTGVDDPDLAILVERAQEQGRAVGMLRRDPEGLLIVSVSATEDGRLKATVCPLRGAHHLTDALRDLIFTPGRKGGSPATVTIFEGPRRVATNVLTTDGARAVDTFVSKPVEERVLREGLPWTGRAWVVNRFVITCYLPIRSPTGKVLGMLYAGLSEAPYLERGQRTKWTFLGLILLVTVAISLVAVWFSRRLARPLTELTEASRALAKGERQILRKEQRGPEEIRVLSQSFDTMAARVVEHTEALEQSREEARQALDAYLEVLAFVAHELKSPVAGAMTALEVLELGYAGEVPEKMRPTLDKLRRYLSRGLAMAVNFTYLSRAESHGFVPKLVPVASLAKEIVGPAIADFVDEATRRKMTFETTGDAGAFLDPDLMRIAVDNLIGNAVKYGAEGSTITIEMETRDGSSLLSVRNRGVGIPDDRLGDVFRKFARVEDKKLRGRRGSGVGLYLCRLITEQHGGTVKADGSYGEWVRFTISLPAAKAVNPPAGEE